MFAKILDFILSKSLIMIGCVLCLSVFVKNIWINIAISTALTISISAITKIIRSHTPKKYREKDFEIDCVLGGKSYLGVLLDKVLDSYTLSEKGDYLTDSSQNSIIVSSLKFGSVSPDELIKVSKDYSSYDKIYFVASGIDRKALAIMHSYAPKITFVPLQAVYKMLKAKKALPESNKEHKQKHNYNKGMLDIIFAKSNIKRYLYVSIVLFAMALLLPFKVYYITLGGINILLSILSLIRSSTHNYHSKNLFDK